MLSFAECKKTIESFEITAHGQRRQEHPTGFKNIQVVIHLKSHNTTEAEVQKLIKMAEDTYCPLWAMVKGNVDVETRVVIVINNTN